MQCERRKRDGRRCKAPALSGKKCCALHSDPDRAKQLGSKGGRRRAATGEGEQDAWTKAAEPVEPPKTAEAVRDLLAQAVAEVKMRKLDTRTANALAYTGATLLKAIEVSSLESRLAALEGRRRREPDGGDDALKSSRSDEWRNLKV
jgi:hypothetical protein